MTQSPNLQFTELLVGGELDFISNSIRFLLRENTPGMGGRRVALPVVMEQVSPDPPLNPTPATFSLSLDAAQKLIDQLYAIGLRPSKMEDNSPVIGAMKEHIADLRRMAFPTATDAREET